MFDSETPSWVRACVEFDERVAVLVVSSYEMKVRGLSVTGLMADRDPAAVEAVLSDFIAEQRPELAGGVVLAIGCTFSGSLWRISYCHRSLPGRKPYEQPAFVQLVIGDTYATDYCSIKSEHAETERLLQKARRELGLIEQAIRETLTDGQRKDVERRCVDLAAEGKR